MKRQRDRISKGVVFDMYFKQGKSQQKIGEELGCHQ